MNNKDIIVIKLWSNVLLDNDWVNKEIISRVVSWVNSLMKKWKFVILVSSGAVALWKKKIWKVGIKWLTSIESEQVFSSLWQVWLINIYQEYFNAFDINVSQALLTRKDFSDRERYNSMKKVLIKSLESWIVPIINENDVLSQEELDFSDNDELSALIAAMVWSEKLVILSNIDWLYDSFPWWNLIKEINTIDEKVFSMVWTSKSTFWKWWMDSKLKTASLIMDLWIEMFLANWKEEWIIERIWNWENPWTVFRSLSNKKVDSIRKWLKTWAVPKWKILVSTIIADLLKSGRRSSLLVIWVEKIVNHFEIKDVVEVCDEKWACIWYWMAKIPSIKVEKLSWNTNKIVIHTDYFISV